MTLEIQIAQAVQEKFKNWRGPGLEKHVHQSMELMFDDVLEKAINREVSNMISEIVKNEFVVPVGKALSEQFRAGAEVFVTVAAAALLEKFGEWARELALDEMRRQAAKIVSAEVKHVLETSSFRERAASLAVTAVFASLSSPEPHS